MNDLSLQKGVHEHFVFVVPLLFNETLFIVYQITAEIFHPTVSQGLSATN